MELTFNKEGNVYVAEFEVTKEFNLHLEKGDGIVKLYQRTVNGNYAWVEDFSSDNKFQRVFDYDSGPIYVAPKWLKIVSDVEPTYAAITTEGEVVEIKAQEKSVEITSNGTTSVEPDAGFSYLTGVTVKTNVPQSGEGGNAGGGSSIEYLDVSGYDFTTNEMAMVYSHLSDLSAGVKVSAQGVTAFYITSVSLVHSAMNQFKPYVTAFAVCPDMKQTSLDGTNTTKTAAEWLAYYLEQEGIDYASIPRITEEEFYNLES